MWFVPDERALRCWGALLGILLLGACAPRGEHSELPPSQHGDTLVALSGPDLARRSDSSIVVIEVDGPSGRRLGTAFVVDTLGLLVTNRHIVEDVTYAYIRGGGLADTVVATVIFASPVCDLAVLRAVNIMLPPLPIDRKDEVQVGEHVYSIGHPKGLEYSISEGVVSGVRREASQPTRIQFTASISPGSSGGPLLDDFGRVVGMNESFLRDGQNINFAVPVEEIRIGVATARAIFLNGADRALVEGEAGLRARFPGYAESVVLDSARIIQDLRALRGQGALETAWELALRAMKAFPVHFELFMEAARIACARKQYDLCEALIDELSVMRPESPVIHNLRGEVLFARRFYRQAHAAYEQCLVATAPCDYLHRDSRFYQSVCSWMLGNAALAVEEMRPAMDCDESAVSGEMWAHFAILLKCADMLEEADEAAIRSRNLLDEKEAACVMLEQYGLPRPVFVESREQEVDGYGRIMVRGIVRNRRPAPIEDIFVTAEGFDVSGKVVATGTGKVEAPLLLNGMTGAFKVLLEGSVSRVVRCDARVVYYK